MEPNPLYQGHTFTPARTPQGDVSPNLPFAEAWQRNYAAMSKHAANMQEALIERVDKTALLNQEAEARNNDLEMTLEMRQMLDLPNGQGGFYNKDGMVDKAAVRSFANKYLTRSRNWHKALISQEAKEKSAQGTRDYQFGIYKALESAIVANTKDRQIQALNENIKLAETMHDYDAVDKHIDEGFEMRALTPQQAAIKKLENEKKQLSFQIDNTNDVNELLGLWYNPETRAKMDMHQLSEDVERKIRLLNKTQAQAANNEYDPKTGKVKKGMELPPDGSPIYIQALFIKHKGTPPEGADDAYAALMRYMSEEITELNTTEKGLRQWNNARAMAKTLGIKNDTEFNKAYELRKAQLSYGGFDAAAVLNGIADDKWLRTTELDEKIPPAKDEKDEVDRTYKLNRIADTIRKDVLNEYNVWFSQNKDRKPSVRAQYAKLLEISKRRAKTIPAFNPINIAIRGAAAETLKRELEVAKEIKATQDRKRKTAKETYNYIQWASRMGGENLYYNGTNINLESLAASMGAVSTNVHFSYDLAQPDLTLPDSVTHNIIYLPKGAELPAKKANVTRRKGNLGFTIEFRHADVDTPTPSLKLLRSLNTSTRPPAYINWNGIDLDVADEQAPDLLPDDGLSTERWTYNDLELPF